MRIQNVISFFFDKFTLIWNSGFRFYFHIRKCISDTEAAGRLLVFFFVCNKNLLKKSYTNLND